MKFLSITRIILDYILLNCFFIKSHTITIVLLIQLVIIFCSEDNLTTTYFYMYLLFGITFFYTFLYEYQPLNLFLLFTY